MKYQKKSIFSIPIATTPAAEPIINILPPVPAENAIKCSADYYFCKPAISRGLSEVVLEANAKKFGLVGEKYSSVKLALKSALLNANQQDIIYVGGSTFVVAEII